MKQLKNKKMKKLLFVAVLGTLVACGDSSSTTPAVDSPVVSVDTAVAPVVADTTVIDTTAAAADTTAH